MWNSLKSLNGYLDLSFAILLLLCRLFHRQQLSFSEWSSIESTESIEFVEDYF